MNTEKVAVVWSKNNCPACSMAKNLLQIKGYSIEVRNIETSWTKEDLLKEIPTARSVPQIVINGQTLSGLDELRKYLD
jgi:glutaredoxin